MWKGRNMRHLTANVYTETECRGSNYSYITTSEGIVLVDTPQLISGIVNLQKEIQNKGPMKYLINTENHIDHIFGNSWFYGKCPIIGDRDILKGFWESPRFDCYDYSVDVIRKQDAQFLHLMPSRDEYQVGRPNILYTDNLTLKVGEQILEIYSTPGHTRGQTAVYFPKEKVVITGDTIFAECQTWLQEADPDAWLKTLDFLETLDVDYVIPGHGPVVAKNYILKQKAFILEWIATVAAAMARGLSKEECVREISFLERFPVDIGQEHSGPMIQELNVKHLFDYLSGNKTGRE
jgi:glyoxylase-like metal-dependent hydrolase (beta-lactamase superfamily II)